MLEAICTRCGETFVPNTPEAADQVHGETEDGTPCGGLGVVSRQFLGMNPDPLDLSHLELLWEHAETNANCDDPDCEFHHPEVTEG